VHITDESVGREEGEHMNGGSWWFLSLGDCELMNSFSTNEILLRDGEINEEMKNEITRMLKL
jgi:hypothetical protein